MSPADQVTFVYFIAKAVQRHRQNRLLVTLAGFASLTADDRY